MKITILFNGDYPGFGAASNRVANYQSGLEENGSEVKVLSNSFNFKKRHLKYLYRFIITFELFLKVMKERNKANIIFVYGRFHIPFP